MHTLVAKLTHIVSFSIALAYQCCDIDPKKRPTAAMCVEELELIAIELRIDEYESKTRMRDSSTTNSTPATSAKSVDLPVLSMQDCPDKTDVSPDDAEFESKWVFSLIFLQ